MARTTHSGSRAARPMDNRDRHRDRWLRAARWRHGAVRRAAVDATSRVAALLSRGSTGDDWAAVPARSHRDRRRLLAQHARRRVLGFTLGFEFSGRFVRLCAPPPRSSGSCCRCSRAHAGRGAGTTRRAAEALGVRRDAVRSRFAWRLDPAGDEQKREQPCQRATHHQAERGPLQTGWQPGTERGERKRHQPLRPF
jgi:hypothetical protein